MLSRSDLEESDLSLARALSRLTLDISETKAVAESERAFKESTISFTEFSPTVSLRFVLAISISTRFLSTSFKPSSALASRPSRFIIAFG